MFLNAGAKHRSREGLQIAQILMLKFGIPVNLLHANSAIGDDIGKLAESRAIAQLLDGVDLYLG